jgi:predicted secreted protein
MSIRKSKCSLLLAVLGTICLGQPASADDKPYYDRVTLSAQAVTEVENDTLVVVLAAQRQGTELAQLASEVNQLMTKALSRCKKVSGIEVQTLEYQTNPVYEKQHLTAWRVSQSLQLKGHDVQSLSALIGDLQNELMLESMSYQISAEARSQAEQSLIAKAISAFSQRAQEITQRLGRKRYRLVNMQVDTGGVTPQPRLRQVYAMSTQAAPAIEAGKQTLSVTVNGVIELLVN